MKFKKSDDENQWLHISDMMSGLMMVFLFIAISYMIEVLNEKDKIKEIAVAYEKIQKNLYDELYKEFEKDLIDWDAEIDSTTLSVKFKSPEILFKSGSDEVEPRLLILMVRKTKKNHAELSSGCEPKPKKKLLK